MKAQHKAIRKQRIVLTTIGSLGDLHSYIAIALGLLARGHDAVVATSAYYRQTIEALGLAFRPIRPDSTFVADPVVMRRMMNSRWGIVRVGREIVMPAMREMYEDISAASGDADLLVSHPLTTYATRLVSEVTGTPWASTMITPLGFMSAYDFPIISVAPTACMALRLVGSTVSSPLIGLAKRATRFLAEPWYRLRKEIGLPPDHDTNPLLDSHSSRLVLALFSPLLAAPKPDWPPHTITTGFPIFDRSGRRGMPPELAEFLDSGPAPIVFTLGCSAAVVGEEFFQTSVAVANHLGHRAVMIVGRDVNSVRVSLPNGVTAHAYAPYSELFPRAACIVHAGGIGATGLAMRSGRPCLVVPYAHDQMDNAARLVRTGMACTIPRHRYTLPRVSAELRKLLSDSRYAQQASGIAMRIGQEDGVATACDALEELLSESGERND
jgi:rhamnosyltransferase subunit B